MCSLYRTIDFLDVSLAPRNTKLEARVRFCVWYALSHTIIITIRRHLQLYRVTPGMEGEPGRSLPLPQSFDITCMC